MITVLAPPGVLFAGAEVALDSQETHHLTVRRAQLGERIRLLDGHGVVAQGTVEFSGKSAVASVEVVTTLARPVPVTLAVSAGDRDRFLWLIEKSTELGATDIVPLETERTPGVAAKLRGSHLERLRRRALETIKQCGAAWAPTVHDSVPLEEWTRRPLAGVGWTADPDGSPPPPQLALEPVTIAVGPEGGLTEQERDRLQEAGFRPVRLGPHILRFETAALAALAVAASARLRGDHG